LILVGPLQ